MGRSSKNLLNLAGSPFLTFIQKPKRQRFLRSQVMQSYFYIVKKSLTMFSELKKDPGIPRLPDLKMKVHNKQKKPPVRLYMDYTMIAVLDVLVIYLGATRSLDRPRRSHGI